MLLADLQGEIDGELVRQSNLFVPLTAAVAVHFLPSYWVVFLVIAPAFVFWVGFRSPGEKIEARTDLFERGTRLEITRPSRRVRAMAWSVALFMAGLLPTILLGDSLYMEPEDELSTTSAIATLWLFALSVAALVRASVGREPLRLAACMLVAGVCALIMAVFEALGLLTGLASQFGGEPAFAFMLLPLLMWLPVVVILGLFYRVRTQKLVLEVL